MSQPPTTESYTFTVSKDAGGWTIATDDSDRFMDTRVLFVEEVGQAIDSLLCVQRAKAHALPSDEVVAEDPGLLTPEEHEALLLSGKLADLVHGICVAGLDREQGEFDWNECAQAIHDIQRRIMSNAAARAYPKLYRLLGGHSPS